MYSKLIKNQSFYKYKNLQKVKEIYNKMKTF